MIQRIHSIDLCRGIAVLVMLAANAWPELYPSDETPILLRGIFSSAAPIFIFLSGVSIRIVMESGKTSRQVWKRSVQIIAIGVMIDLFVWQIHPFANFDVLYLIGISSILIWYFGQLPSGLIKWAVALTFLFIHLAFISHYRFEMEDFPINEFPDAYSFPGTLKRLILDGWFPLFPWVGVSFLGYLTYEQRSKLVGASRQLLILGICGVLVFSLQSLLESIVQPARDGYVELFYPVKIWFYFLLLGIFMIIVWSYSKEIESFRLVRLIGSFSLPIYVFHTIYINYLLTPLSDKFPSFSWSFLLGALSLLLSFVFILSWLLKRNAYSLKYGKLNWIGFILGI